MLIVKKSKVFHWTHHARGKMRFYRLSESRVRRVIHSPKRIEEGIAPKTVAMMQPNAVKRSAEGGRGETWNQELWVMLQDRGHIRKVISAWRYPGMTKPGTPLPEEVLREIRAGVSVSRETSPEFENKEEARSRMGNVLKKWRRTLRG